MERISGRTETGRSVRSQSNGISQSPVGSSVS